MLERAKPTLDELRVRGAGIAAGAIGQLLLAQHTDRLARHLTKVMRERPTDRKRDPMSLTPELFDALQGIPKATLAQAMLRGCIDANDIIGQKAPPRVKKRMGEALELQARGVAVWKALTPEDWRDLTKEAAKKISLRRKREIEFRLLRARNITIALWPQDLVALAGAFACDMLLAALPDVCVEENGIARISEEAANAIGVDLRQEVMRDPLIEPPTPWGGFWNLDGEPFVERCRDVLNVELALSQDPPIPHLTAVNYLQSTPFAVNEHTLDVVKRRHLLKKVKTLAAERLLDANVDLADRFRGAPFYIPLGVDFRGRLLPRSTFNFTGPDHIRGLFKFAEGAPITERGIYWLKIACATAYDELRAVSKQTFAQRLQWTEDNLSRICAAGLAPLDHLDWLGEAGDPIQCVALFNELAQALEVGPSYICTVPIGFDASCSGLQHYALLARDRRTAERVNLVGGAPQDIYGDILQAVHYRLANVNDEEAQWWIERLDRKIAKGLVMTYCYSSVPWGQANKVYELLRKHDPQINIPAGAPANLVDLARLAIEWFVPIAPKVMEQLRAFVDKTEPVSWVSPSGLPVSNNYPKPQIKRVRHYLHNDSRRCVISAEWKKEQRFDKAKSSIAPNYVHSLDAAHLALVACACEREEIPLVTVHDSYVTLPCHADRLRGILLEELRGMYVGYKRTLVVPPYNDLDLNEVIGEYAFS
jgi:DNA-directed RNA polymerase